MANTSAAADDLYLAGCFTATGASDDVSGNHGATGGLVGKVTNTGSAYTLIQNCYSQLNVDSNAGAVDAKIGGLIGHALAGTGTIDIKNTYATGDVWSSASATGAYSGGLIGEAGDAGITISYSFSTGDVSGGGGSGVARRFYGRDGTGGGITANNYTWSGSTCTNCSSQGVITSVSLLTDFYDRTKPPMSPGTGNWDFANFWIEKAGKFPELIFQQN